MEFSRDRRLLYAAVFLRAFATSMIGVLLGLHLAARGLGRESASAIVAAGLAGAAAAALGVTVGGDRLRRKTALVGLTALSAAGAALFPGVSGNLALALVAFAGMLNGMGRDRGAVLILEQALLPATTDDRGRTRVFAVYNILQDAGHALGSLAAAVPSRLHALRGVDETLAQRGGFVVAAVLLLAAALLYVGLSPALSAPPRARVAISPESRRVLWKISTLFALDSFGGGFLTTALLGYFFVERFGVTGGGVGALFFGARVLNAFSHLGAAWLSKRIGLVNTMVFTHIPSSLFLATVPFAPSFGIAAILFLLREGLVEMDVPTRQSYVMAVVKPEERTFASGVTHLVRMGMWAAAPSIGGLIPGGGALFVGAGLKIVYDVLLFVSFRNLKPPEESHAQN